MLGVSLLWSFAAAPAAGTDVHVVQVDGVLDRITASFLLDRIAASPEEGAQVVVVTVNSSASYGVDLAHLVAAVHSSPVPIVVWVGARASARAAARDLVEAADFVALAPDASVEPPVESDLVAPVLGEVVVGLHGRTIKGRELRTARAITDETGRTRLQPAVTVRFYKPNFVQRVLHAMTSPNIAVFLLLAGLTAIAFEFFTAGIGMAAITGAGCLALSLYGLAGLPTRWPAIVAIGAGVVVMGADVQRGTRSLLTAAGTMVVTTGVFTSFWGAPSGVRLSWWIGTLLVALLVFFWGIGLPVMVRTRYGAPQVMRDRLVGEHGTAATELAPSGFVRVRGATWGARADDGSVAAGSPVEVTGVDGITLRVRKEGPLDGAVGTSD